VGAAALHLAHAQQTPVKKRRPKRTGGGNGNRFAEYAHRIYQDDRADTQARQLLLATAYAVTMAPLDEETSVWRAICNALGSSVQSWSHLRRLIREDIPRYEAPRRWVGDSMEQLCRGPRMRPHPGGPEDFRNRLKVCGDRAQEMAVEKDPVTGWHTNHWFCNRHRDHLIRVRDQVKAQNEAAPEPIPNRGGLLPCYFDSDWIRVYTWAQGWEWEPPSYGYRADDWPVPGKDPIVQRARLRLVVGGADLEGE
jgi:hypothetical protein